MGIIIRTAVSEDCCRIRPLQKEIALLHHNSRPDLFQNVPKYWTQQDFDAKLANREHLVLIAEENGMIVGYTFAWVQHIRNHPVYYDFDNFYIDDICVAESHRRRGIGRMLFERCKAHAKALGCQRKDLGVYAFNQDAIAFYESMGMTERMRKMEYHLEEETE